MKHSKIADKSKYSDADILANVGISESPERLLIEKLLPELQDFICSARLQGYRPVCVYWPDGKDARLLIPADASIPTPEIIIAAYRQCEKTDKVFPEGAQSWKN